MTVLFTDTFAASAKGRTEFIVKCFVEWRKVHPDATRYMGHDVPYYGHNLLWHVHLRPNMLSSTEHTSGLSDHWDKTLRKTSNIVLTFAKNGNDYLLFYVSDEHEPHVLPALKQKLFQSLSEEWVKTGNYPGKDFNIASNNKQKTDVPVTVKKKKTIIKEGLKLSFSTWLKALL